MKKKRLKKLLKKSAKRELHLRQQLAGLRAALQREQERFDRRFHEAVAYVAQHGPVESWSTSYGRPVAEEAGNPEAADSGGTA